jgi:hypothetical protein
MVQLSEMDRRFHHHPATDDSRPRYEKIRAECLRLALLIDSLAPESRERALSFTALEECMMWANASIARNQETLPPLDVYKRRFRGTL